MINNVSFSPPLGNSDHVCIGNFDLVCYTECKQISSVKYNVGAANLELVNEFLRSVDWESTCGGLDVNDSWGYFKLVYQDAIDNLNINQN